VSIVVVVVVGRH